MAGQHEGIHRIETPEETRERIRKERIETKQEYNRQTREAMRSTINAQEGSINSVERVVWGLTGSDEELRRQEDLAYRIGSSVGQPLLALLGGRRGFLGFIREGLEGELIDNNWGQLQVYLGKTVRWDQSRPGPRGELCVDDEAKMTLCNIHYEDTNVMDLAVRDTDTIKYAAEPTCETLLIGMPEILESEDVDLKKYAEQFALLTSANDSVQ